MAETVVEALSLGTTQRFDVLFGVYESDTHAKDRLRLLTGEGGWQDWHGGVQTRADATTVITLLRVAQRDAVAGARR